MPVLSETPLRILYELMIEDRWRAAADRGDDYAASTDQVNILEAIVQFLARESATLQPFIPDIARFTNIFTETSGDLRNGNDFSLHFETGNETSYA